MATKTDHVMKRDGSLHLGGPPTPPSRPAKPLREAETGIGEFGGAYSRSDYVGTSETLRGAFEAARGNPGPRGPEVDAGGTHQEPGDASIAAAVPLT